MKAFMYLVLLFIQISFNYGTLPFIQYKCLTFDSECLKARAQFLTPAITKGIPELGIERLDPLFIDCVNIDKNGFKLDIQNVYVEGLKNAIIDEYIIDMHTRIIRLVYHTDYLTKGLYKAGGQLFSLPIYGQGDVQLRYNNVQVEMIMPFEIVKDVHHNDIIDLQGYQYLHKVRGGGVHRLENLYYGDKESSDRMHALLDQNWDFLSTQFGRFVFDKVNDKVFNVLRAYLHSRPLENLKY